MVHWLLGEELDELEPRDFRGAEAATAVITNTHCNDPLNGKRRIKVDHIGKKINVDKLFTSAG